MIGGLKPYPAYKDSGVPWLGEVPEHWEVRRLKTLAKLNPSKSEVPYELRSGAKVAFLPMEQVGSDGQGDFGDTRDVASVWTGFTYFRRGDVLVAKITPCFENGKGVCLDRMPTPIGFGSTEFHVLRAQPPATPQFLYRIASLPEFRRLGADAMTGAAGQQRVPEEFVAAFNGPLPPISEQAAIVRFLDHADRRIRRYVRVKQKLIALLNEMKQGIIHRAVTRSLDPNVRLKPSGVEWLGEIPEHWAIRRNGQLFSQRNQVGFADLPILEVSLRTGVRIRDFENSDRKQVMSDRDKYKRAVKGDIAYNMMRMWQGAVGVAPIDGLVSPAYVVARPIGGTESRYFSNLFRTAAYMSEIDKYSRGIVKDRNRLYWEDFKQMPSPCPPTDEQVLVADAIDKSTQALNCVMGQAQRQIDLIREYRTRLISDVVTGKLDVRAAAANLPEEREELAALGEAEAQEEGNEESGEEIEAAPEEAEA